MTAKISSYNLYRYFPGNLRKGLFTDALYLFDLFDGAKAPVLLTVLHDPTGKRLSNPIEFTEFLLAGSIEVNLAAILEHFSETVTVSGRICSPIKITR